MKNFFENFIGLLEGIHEANAELIKGFGEVGKEFKNDMKDLIKDHNPVIGDAIETIDRGTQSIANFIDANNPINVIKRELRNEPELEPGDHLCVQRFGYTHHGIKLEGETVLHYSEGFVKIDSIADFKGVSTINKIDSPIIYPKEMVIARGYSKLGQSNYNVVFNNCEHFVNWCRSGSKTTDNI